MMHALTPLPQIIVQFVDLKEWLLASFGLSNDAMHINVGLAIHLGLMLILALRGRTNGWLPFGVLTLISLVAEVFDIIAQISVGSQIYTGESVRDVGSTLFWPLVLSLLLTWHRRRPDRR